ncbi:MAG: thioredoxin family protein, partial [Myxococcales bacterium]|nr:thioredoxin family protein [Myxococcales bacterium]
NVMPCVLPVLTLKVYDVVEKAKTVEPAVNRKHGLAYTAGIMAFYLPVGVLVGLTKAPANTMFQNPMLTAGLCLLMFALGLNALGVFEITIGMSADSEGDGFRASAAKGLLAAVMSIPCSAPMLGIALGVAVAADTSAFETILIYAMVGLGLALPFLVISFSPRFARWMPRPGMWMDKFKKLMGFTLMGAAVWLYNVLDAQIAKDSSDWFLFFTVLVALILWAQGAFGGLEHSNQRRAAVKLSALLVAGAAGFFVFTGFHPPEKTAGISAAPVKDSSGAYTDPPVVVNDHIAWAAFSPDDVKANLDRGRPVFMDYTADWCLNCKSNEKAFIETDPIRAKLQAHNILPMKADFTNEDEVIEEWIKELGRGGIPIYVIYLPNGKNILLPETISTQMLSEALDKAASEFPKGSYKPPAPTTASSKDAGTAEDEKSG